MGWLRWARLCAESVRVSAGDFCGLVHARPVRRVAASARSVFLPGNPARASRTSSATPRVAGLFALVLATLIAASGQAFAAGPTVSSVSTNSTTSGAYSYAGGESFTITGSGFWCGGTLSSNCSSLTVTIDGATASNIVVNSDTSITAKTPADPDPPTSPTVTAPSGGIVPNYGSTSGGTAVTINGSGFGHSATVQVTTNLGSGSSSSFVYDDVEQVSIGGTNATFVANDFDNSGELSLSTPAGIAGVSNVLVTTYGGNTLSTGNNEFAYIPGGLGISSIGPNFGLVNTSGNQVIITDTSGGFVAPIKTARLDPRSRSAVVPDRPRRPHRRPATPAP